MSSGHRCCPGCGEVIATRQILLASQRPTVISCATGCLEVTTTIFPYTAWMVPFIHSAFENASATISGVYAAFSFLKKKGSLKGEIDFIAFGGDGGTYDIGLQSLSGALERYEKFLYVCINNQAYMNTGIQRSSATPFGAHTTTTQAGKVSLGKTQEQKDLTAIVAAHNIPYVAQAVVGDWHDLLKKTQKALAAPGPSFINVLSPCPLGWGFPSEDTIKMGRLAVETGFWVLYEIENGHYKITKIKNKKPIIEFIKPQARFKHLLEREDIISLIQKRIDTIYNELLKKEVP